MSLAAMVALICWRLWMEEEKR